MLASLFLAHALPLTVEAVHATREVALPVIRVAGTTVIASFGEALLLVRRLATPALAADYAEGLAEEVREAVLRVLARDLS